MLLGCTLFTPPRPPYCFYLGPPFRPAKPTTSTHLCMLVRRGAGLASGFSVRKSTNDIVIAVVPVIWNLSPWIGPLRKIPERWWAFHYSTEIRAVYMYIHPKMCSYVKLRCNYIVSQLCTRSKHPPSWQSLDETTIKRILNPCAAPVIDNILLNGYKLQCLSKLIVASKVRPHSKAWRCRLRGQQWIGKNSVPLQTHTKTPSLRDSLQTPLHICEG